MLLFHGQEDDLVKDKEFAGFVQKTKSNSNNFAYRDFPGRGHFFYDPESNQIIDSMPDQF